MRFVHLSKCLGLTFHLKIIIFCRSLIFSADFEFVWFVAVVGLCLSLQSSHVSGSGGAAAAGQPPPRPPPPRPPLPALPGSPTVRSVGHKRPLSQGQHLAAIVESAPQGQAQQEEGGEEESEAPSGAACGDEWVALDHQESVESNKSKKSASTPSQSSIDECVEATEDLTSSGEVETANTSKEQESEGVDLEDIDAIVAEFEQLRKQSEEHDAKMDAHYANDRKAVGASESKVITDKTDGTVAFKPKKPLGYSKSLPVQTSSTSLRTREIVESQSDNLHEVRPERSSESRVNGGSEENLLHKDHADGLYCAWDRSKRDLSKKRRGGSFFNKWRNKDKAAEESDSASAEHSDANPEAASDSERKDSSSGIMRRLSRIVKNQAAEDAEDSGAAGAGSGLTSPRKRKSRLDQKISFVDLSMEEVPKHPPVKKMTYGDHVHVGTCLTYVPPASCWWWSCGG